MILYILLLLHAVQSLQSNMNIDLDMIENFTYIDSITNPDSRESIFPRLYLNETFIKIGGLFSIIDSDGTSLFYSIQRLLTFQCTINYVNHLNILNGKFLIYEVIDTQRHANEALDAALNMLQHQDIVMIIGPGTAETDASIPVASIITSYNVSGISYDAGGPSEVFKYEFGYARTNPTDEFSADAAIALCLAFNWTLITPIFIQGLEEIPDNAYFTSRANDSGIYFDCEAYIPGFNNILDSAASRLVLKNTSVCLSSSQSKIIVVFMPLDLAVNVITSIADNVPGIVYVSSTFSLYSPDVEKIAPELAISPNFIGSIAIVPPEVNIIEPPSSFCSLIPDPLTNPYPPLIDYWQRAFHCYISQSQAPPDTPILSLCPHNTSLRNIKNISCICTGNETIDDLPLDPRSSYVADAVIFYASALNRILTNCDSIPFGDYCNKTYLTGLDIFLVGNAFPVQGNSGPLRFHNGDRVDPSMQVVQIHSSGEILISTIGNYSNDGMKIDYSRLHFNGNDIPISAITPRDEDLSTPFGVITFSIAIILCIIVILLTFIVYAYRDTPIVKRMSPIFCILILIGMILSLISVIMWCIKPSTITCILEIWTFVIGIDIIIANLLAKTYRLYKIFHGKRQAIIKGVSDRDMLVMSSIIICIDVVLLLIFTFISGLPGPVVVHLESNFLYSYTVCRDGSITVNNAIIDILIVLDVIILFFCTFSAYQIRNIDERFNESTRIAIIVYFISMIATIAITVYHSVENTNEVAAYQFATVSYGVFAIVIAIAVILFEPVVLVFYNNMRMKYRKSDIIETGNLSHGLDGTYVNHYHIYSDAVHIQDEFAETENESSIDRHLMENSTKFVSKGIWKNQRVASTWMDLSDASIHSDSRASHLYPHEGSATLSTIASEKPNK